VRPIELSFTTTVAAPRDVVWARVTTMSGVNAELAPFVRMTHPAELHSLADVTVEPGVVLHRSWLLAGRVLPFDRHALALERVMDREGFDEESTSWLQRRWRHERRLRDAPGGGTVVSDHLEIEPRLAFAAPLTRAMVGFLFRHRHRRLLETFGTP
jgi:ligand-binding SRPBCC domain-containing protein